MELHFRDVTAGYCRKCDRTFRTEGQLYAHYQTDLHKKRAQKLRMTKERTRE